ncbi:4Fe-4S dicluster domain-containing protein [Candidatus Thorarchaeota archaeon]|nr:MAG: 4Fe-4S dicluster domain-containing protein [Candidatus Thorarchaeota archaeon]
MSKDHKLIVDEIQRVLKEKTKIYSFKKLDREIIQTGACVECGSCVESCPVNAITGNLIDEKYTPQLTGDCISCGICYAMCPRTHVLEEQLIGNVRSIWKARSLGNHAKQDGGAVIAILKFMLESKIIEGAVVVNKSKDTPWFPETRIARNNEDLLKCGGTIYTHAQVIAKMLEGFKIGLSSLAVVGTPCNIEAIQRMERHPAGWLKLNSETSVFKISLFCMESFDHRKLQEFLLKSNIKIEDVKWFAIAGGEFKITLENNERKWPIAELDIVAATSCAYCQDLTGFDADISCGNIGSDAGWTTVIVRTSRGEEVLMGTMQANLIEAIPLEEKEIQAIINSSRFKKNKYYKLSSNHE